MAAKVSDAEAKQVVLDAFKWFEANVGDEQMSADFMIEAIKQARLHLDSTFEDKFKWGGAPKPANYNDYRKHKSFLEHAQKIYNVLKKYMTEGDIDQSQKDHLVKIHYDKGVKTVQFHYILNGLLIAGIRHGYLKGRKEHDNFILDDSQSKIEQSFRQRYDVTKYGLQF